MPRIFDNIQLHLMTSLKDALGSAKSADFCVGFFNLRGWNELGKVIENKFTGEGASRCRLLIGMQRVGDDDIRDLYGLASDQGIDSTRAIQLRKKMAEQFRSQLCIGAPTATDEANLQRLARQLRSGKVVVKLFLRNTLHAKLYLMHRSDTEAPIVGFVGSSNLTFAGLMTQSELNVDVVEGDAAAKLSRWFEDRWNDQWCISITEELAEIIETSWARPTPIPPYHIYIKIAYHLAREARAGLSQFTIPKDFGNQLFEFQVAAVKIAAHHLSNEKRRGVVLGDVVGLGKTLMATALAKIFEEDLRLETLIICPKNLVTMWEDHIHKYRLVAKVVPVSMVTKELPELKRYRLVIIDESHNLRNRETQSHRAIREYIAKNECRCILLSATPYNKAYLDLGAQLRLFLQDDQDLGIRPELLMKEVGQTRFQAKFQISAKSLAAFEKSEYPDDWRDLMRLFMVRRTRGFVKENYAQTDESNGRKYLLLGDGSRSYFPDRVPRTVKFEIDDAAGGPYARLYHESIVEVINSLNLPRYGLLNHILNEPDKKMTPDEEAIVKDLGRAGKRIMGFCRTNLFKRLESSGLAFIQSLERHALRNYVFLYAIETGQPLPIGSTDPGMLDPEVFDRDAEEARFASNDFEDGEVGVSEDVPQIRVPICSETEFRERAKKVYEGYRTHYKRRMKWLRPDFFAESLAEDLRTDAGAICEMLAAHGHWDPSKDHKLTKLYDLLTKSHATDKVIVFTQFADTVKYLTEELKKRGVRSLEGVTGDSEDPTKFAWRFSPVSNEKREWVSKQDELRVLIATDVLSEGQNLQDAHVVVNFDLPWAIIKLIQRAGRVDRIGQRSDEIFCYSFYPMDGVERIINLRGRVRQRLAENEVVVGADEIFFEDMQVDHRFRDLYNEKAGVLDQDDDADVDISSQALQIWKNAIDADPTLKPIIENMPDVVFSAKEHIASPTKPDGALVYLKTSDGNDALAWVDEKGEPVTESPVAILRAAACGPETPASNKAADHHEIVRKGIEQIVKEGCKAGGQLGRESGARYRTYMRLKGYADKVKGSLLESEQLLRTIDDIYKYPLRQTATDALNRQLTSGVGDLGLSEVCITLRDEGKLCIVAEEQEDLEPRVICSMGLVGGLK